MLISPHYFKYYATLHRLLKLKSERNTQITKDQETSKPSSLEGMHRKSILAHLEIAQGLHTLPQIPLLIYTLKWIVKLY
jgi:hypothetical protein